MHAKSLQSGPTLCDTMDCSSPGSSVHGDSPGNDNGVGSRALLQGIFLTRGSNPGLLMSPALAGGFFTTGATWEAHKHAYIYSKTHLDVIIAFNKESDFPFKGGFTIRDSYSPSPLISPNPGPSSFMISKWSQLPKRAGCPFRHPTCHLGASMPWRCWHSRVNSTESKAAGSSASTMARGGDLQEEVCEMHYEGARQGAIVFLSLIVENQYGCFLFGFQGHKWLLLWAGEVHRVVNEMSVGIEQFKQNWRPSAVSLPYVNGEPRGRWSISRLWRILGLTCQAAEEAVERGDMRLPSLVGAGRAEIFSQQRGCSET